LDRQEQRRRANSDRSGDGINGGGIGAEETKLGRSDRHSAGPRCDGSGNTFSFARAKRISILQWHTETDIGGRAEVRSGESTCRGDQSATGTTGDSARRIGDTGGITPCVWRETGRVARKFTARDAAGLAAPGPGKRNTNADTTLNMSIFHSEYGRR
jgi:hypothetical protein